jgi:hypothetical protein
VNADDLEVRGITDQDRRHLSRFRCSAGQPWEDRVEEQIRGPLASRYLSTPPHFDGRILLGFDAAGTLIVVGAHHIEPSLSPDVGYVEVIAVAASARGTLVELPQCDPISLGHFMLLTIFRQMQSLGRHCRTFARVDPRNTRSLALLDRVGLLEEREDGDPALVQRWGEMPAAATGTSD